MRQTIRAAAILVPAAVLAVVALAYLGGLSPIQSEPTRPVDTHTRAHHNSPSCGDIRFVSCSYLRTGHSSASQTACDNERDGAWVVSQTVKANGQWVSVSTRGQGISCDHDSFPVDREPRKHRLKITNGITTHYRPWSYH